MQVSVVIPAFNRAWIIGEALQSVFAQTFQDFEVLVIDDGSTDNTADVVKSFADPRLRYVKKYPNAGVGAAWNSGIRAARGEFVSFLDSDDLWKPDKLEREVCFLDTHPEVQAVFSDLEKTDRGEFTPSFMRRSPNFCRLLTGIGPAGTKALTQREAYLCLLREVFIKPSAMTIRRDVLLKTNLFDERWPSGNDWKLFLEISRSFRFGYIDRPLAVLRVQGDAIHWRHMVRDKMLTIEMLRNEIRTSSADKAAVKSARWGISNMSKHLSWYYLGRRQRGAAARALFQGFGYTYDFGLLTRGIAALLPASIRMGAKRLLRRNTHPMPTDL